MDLLAVVKMLVLCRYCSAQDGGCTPPAGSNLIGGYGKLGNNIPQSNRGVPGSEFNVQTLIICILHWLFLELRGVIGGNGVDWWVSVQ